MNNLQSKVVKVLDEYRVVINRGRADGISPGNRFLVYEIGEELFDPDTNESLGVLEIVKGRAKPSHIQERITTLVCLEQERIKKRSGAHIPFLATEHEEIRELPFDGAKDGDLARLLNESTPR